VSARYLVAGYQVVGLLRRSDMYDVYDAWSDERQCRCVVKLLREQRRERARDRARVRREGRLVLALAHPHIVRAYEVGSKPTPYIALESATGATLERILEDDGPLGARDLRRLGSQLCSALGYLHGRGYLHLDVKTSNVACDRGFAKLLDLSIARRPGRGRRGVGTRPYLAPEQRQGRLLTGATDVWGLGSLLYEAATGQRPYATLGADGYPTFAGAPPAVATHRRLPGALARAIDRCLDLEPRGRPSITELASLLATIP